MTTTKIYIRSFLAIAFIITIAFGSADSEDDGTRSSSYHKMLAYNVAEEYVKVQLKSPSTADFPGIYEKEKHIFLIDEGKFEILSWVDSQNSFGATVRSKWSCEVFIDNEDNVKVSKLKIY